MRLLFQLSAAVLLATLALAACNSSETKGNRAASSASSNSAVKFPDASSGHIAPSDGVKRVTTIEVRDALEKGTAIVVDVRGDSVYKQSHIKGSISIPENQIAARISELPRDKMIVTYCS
jgi:3-mercaptopyruvate sulfurtransferase SseA